MDTSKLREMAEAAERNRTSLVMLPNGVISLLDGLTKAEAELADHIEQRVALYHRATKAEADRDAALARVMVLEKPLEQLVKLAESPSQPIVNGNYTVGPSPLSMAVADARAALAAEPRPTQAEEEKS